MNSSNILVSVKSLQNILWNCRCMKIKWDYYISLTLVCSPKFRYLPSLGMRNAYSSAEKRPKSRKECLLKLSKYFSIVGWDNYYILKKLKEKSLKLSWVNFKFQMNANSKRLWSQCANFGWWLITSVILFSLSRDIFQEEVRKFQSTATAT